MQPKTRKAKTPKADEPVPDWRLFAEWFNETLLDRARDFSHAVRVRAAGTEAVRSGADLERSKSRARELVDLKSSSGPPPSPELIQAYELTGKAIQGRATPRQVAQMVRELAPMVTNGGDRASFERWGLSLENADTWREVQNAMFHPGPS